MVRSSDALDREVRLFVYRHIIDDGRAPGVDEVAAALKADQAVANAGHEDVLLDVWDRAMRQALPLLEEALEQEDEPDQTCGRLPIASRWRV